MRPDHQTTAGREERVPLPRPTDDMHAKGGALSPGPSTEGGQAKSLAVFSLTAVGLIITAFPKQKEKVRDSTVEYLED